MNLSFVEKPLGKEQETKQLHGVRGWPGKCLVSDKAAKKDG